MTGRTGHDEPLSIQQQFYPWASCFGCGPDNSKGLQLRSYARDGVITATFEPWPEHDNGDRLPQRRHHLDAPRLPQRRRRIS